MALQKNITLENGITLTYHRISEIGNIINSNTRLTIISYLNKEQRDKDRPDVDYIIRDTVYKTTYYEHLPYNDTLTITQAYEYLKTTDKFKDAADVFEDDDLENK